MKYYSFFSGIGGFEVAIHEKFTNPICLGYSEIEKNALTVYRHHYPNHPYLGDITKIKPSTLSKCDLVVAGFPCTNLSSVANFVGDNRGLKGKESSLFFYLVKIINVLKKKNPDLHVIIENNASMNKKYKEEITYYLEKILSYIHITIIDNACFGVQRRKRIFWTTFKIPEPINCNCYVQKWSDVLEPIQSVQKYKYTDKKIACFNKPVNGSSPYYITIVKKNRYYTARVRKQPTLGKITRFQLGFTSDTWLNKKQHPFFTKYTNGKCGTLVTSYNHLLDRRGCPENMFIVRDFSPLERERLFGLCDGYSNLLSDNQRKQVLGRSVSVLTLEYIFSYYPN